MSPEKPEDVQGPAHPLVRVHPHTGRCALYLGRLLLIARGGREAAELEFIAAPGEENLEDRMVLLAERGGAPAEHEISLRLLRHYASSVRHQQYHGTDIVTIRVEGDTREQGAAEDPRDGHPDLHAGHPGAGGDRCRRRPRRPRFLPVLAGPRPSRPRSNRVSAHFDARFARIYRAVLILSAISGIAKSGESVVAGAPGGRGSYRPLPGRVRPGRDRIE